MGHVTLNFSALGANSSKMAKSADFKFGTDAPRDSPDMSPKKIFKKGGWSRSSSGQPSFSSADTARTIKQAKASESFGLDNISTLHWKHLGPAGTDYLTAICNFSLASSEIPSLWKMCRMLTSLKAGKDPSSSSSVYFRHEVHSRVT